MKNIPNIITCLNLFSGCMACTMALQYENYIGAFIFIALAAVFDFLDGFLARILKAYSKLGAELDSLADVISFGLAPGCIVYIYLDSISQQLNISGLSLVAFLLPMFSAIRLAKFNIDTRQTSSFLGLPVPANALFWSSFIPTILPYTPNNLTLYCATTTILLIVFCLLLVSEIPMFSLKSKNFTWKGNEWPYSLLFLSIVIIFSFYLLCNSVFPGISMIIIVFIIMSLIKNRISKS